MIVKMLHIWSLFLALVLIALTTAAPSENVNGSLGVSDARCGKDHVCVQKTMCKSEPVDNRGNFKIEITYRTSESQCNYWQTCCHKNNTTAATPVTPVANKLGECGFRNTNGVIGTLDKTPNKEAQFGEFPWMVALYFASSLIGGGSIIAPNVVATSANKVEQLDRTELLVRAGEWDISTTTEALPHADRNVKQVIIHERFSRLERSNDIALLVLETAFTSQPNIAPICLPTQSDKFDLQRCIVMGWGKTTQESTEYPHVLKKISLNVVPEAVCNDFLSRIMGQEFKIDPTSICAGGEKGVDACLGDGGAPLVCPMKGSENRYKLAGIVAWGAGCGLENVPAGYTNVAAMMPWVNGKLMEIIAPYRN